MIFSGLQIDYDDFLEFGECVFQYEFASFFVWCCKSSHELRFEGYLQITILQVLYTNDDCRSDASEDLLHHKQRIGSIIYVRWFLQEVWRAKCNNANNVLLVWGKMRDWSMEGHIILETQLMAWHSSWFFVSCYRRRFKIGVRTAIRAFDVQQGIPMTS